MSYAIRLYNHSYANERIVEIPIFEKILKNNSKKEVLEIGNVLSHYMEINHTVVDKYEKGIGVINEDALTYQPKKKFDCILAISTFEHIGYDEQKKDNQKIIKAINHLKTLLKKDGVLYFSVPFGYNPNLDKLIKENKIKVDQQTFLQRINNLNEWQETTKEIALKKKYDTPYSNANAIMIGVINS